MSETIRELAGEFRAPRNAWQGAPGSIHTDEVASKLGFKGGTIPGSVHMDQFVPMLLEVYGPKWFETGDISLHFVQATVDAEKVRAVVRPGEERARLTMFNEAGALICEGTASVNAPDPKAELVGRMEAQAAAEPGRLRILADLAVGDETGGYTLTVTEEHLEKSLKILTEPLPVYARDKVLPPSHLVSLAHGSRKHVMAKVKNSVGLFGALEVRQLKGPLHAGVEYAGRTNLLKLTESPRTENAWYDVFIADPKTGEDLASVRFMLRFMKASSPLWAEGASA
jgi:hypothetical protein